MDILKKIFTSLGSKTKDKPDLKVLFHRFREVIESNTKALEIIADMGDKLSGDYIFDMAYIRKVTKDLSEAVFHSVHNLNLLCQNRYQELYQIFDQIETRLEALIENKVADGPFAVILDENCPEDIDLLGGKMAHLLEIKRHLGLNIPKGFVITSAAFNNYLTYNKLHPLLEELKEALEDQDTESIELKRKKIEKKILEGKISPELDKALKNALNYYKEVCKDRPLVIRSSAQEEDQELSFAGQFETIINVPPTLSALIIAYKKVIASLFGPKAISYARKFGSHLLEMAMAVGCLEMVEARTSGVIFTINPQDPHLDTLLITANWGLGGAVVEGRFPVDRFVVSRSDPNHILEKDIADKTHCLLPSEDGTIETEVAPEIRKSPCLTNEEVRTLAKIGLSLERYFKRPQDIEWVINPQDVLYLLQSRPLSISNEIVEIDKIQEVKKKYPIIVEKKGIIAQSGIAAGQVFLLKSLEELDKFPEGAILVAPRDSSQFVRIMPKVAAILTNIGSPTSHMATLCREFRVPAIVGMGDITERVQPGEVITVDAEDNCIYKGKVEELLKFQAASQLNLADTKEFRLLRKILRFVAPLNLVDPLLRNFKPEFCKTFHDILRFCHEKAVEELVSIGKEKGNLLNKDITKKLDLPIPTGILIIDLGGGLKPGTEDKDEVKLDDIECIPFKYVLSGMLEPNVWQTEAVQLQVKDFIYSMIKTPEISPSYLGENIAVISTYYLNLSLRFGYHFNILDTYCSPNIRENHIYFRFIGGAADLAKRSRRIKLIEKILSYYDFNIMTKGDLLVARIANIPLEEAAKILKMIGRLIGFTRQLDVLMEDDSAIEEAYRKFLFKK
ncbi:PEP/pyruvate-binding domain-containing protein [Thermodesulfatator atlanticus]|uniref:PEP/pyruvate-binding domain-containing protein n=1 Tax=Thermodesulfatator atlanticus TaxID=501497 RepID=UPI0003B5A967|nr:PEP/pyruvate-binding domain-containing protein [Thermodesulfatator atlanticus]